MQRFLAFVLAVLTGVPAFADSPVIWNGSYGRNLTSKGFLLSNGAQLNNDGPINYAPQKAVKWTVTGLVTVADATSDSPRPNTVGNGVTFAATGAGTAYFCYTLDPADYNKKLAVSFEQNATSGVASTYVANDFQLDVYSSTSSTCASGTTRLALSTDASAISGLPALTGTYRTTFDAPGSAAQYVKVTITRAANSHSIVLANFYTGPGIVTQGAAITGWTSYTPTGSWVSNSTYTGRYRRVGESMEVDATVSLAGAPTAADLGIDLPSGFTINTTALSGSGGVETSPPVFGSAAIRGGALRYSGNVVWVSTTRLQVISGVTASNNGIVDNTHPVTFANGDSVSIRAVVPINEWTGSGTVNVISNDYLYGSSDGTTTHCGLSNGDAVPTTTPSGTKSDYDLTSCFNTQSPNSIVLEYQVAGGSNAWTPSGGTQILSTCNFDGTNTIGACVRGTGGAIQLTQGKYPNSNGTSTPWSSATTASTRWRAKQYTGTGAVGFANVTQTGAGLVQSAGQLLGTNTNDSATAGNVGEMQQTLQGSLQTAGSSNAFHTALTTPTLTAGNWCIYATFNLVPNGGTCTSPVEVSVATGASGGATSGYDDMAVDCPGSSSQTMVNFPCIPVKIANGATATYNLNYDVVWATTAPRWRGSITAVRIR